MRRLSVISILAVAVASWSASLFAEGQGAIQARFRVFDGTHYKGKPDLSRYGMESASLVYEAALFDRSTPVEEMPKAEAVRRVAVRGTTVPGITVIDVERWIDLADATTRYVSLLRQLKSFAPDLKTGYYSVVPKRDYWRAKEGQADPRYAAWQRENDELQPLADEVDFLFPSLYTFYDHQPGWVAYAEENIREARRLAKGKPVYAFLWPTYHESNVLLKGKAIPGDYWRLQLETVRRLADGVVIWGGGAWDPEAEWWRETMKFLPSSGVTR